jgi:uncharacterized glyoxalase superfamily protein PhnB
MKPTPKGWPRISSSIYYEDPAAAIDWLVTAFGFEVRLKVEGEGEGEGGAIVHSELTFGDGLVMVGGVGTRTPGKEAWQAHQVSPRGQSGGNTQTLCLFVDDVDAHCAHARKAGATVFREPETSDYGEDYWADRSYGATDPEGHMWWFMKRVREPHDKG